jgi:hypothetical protein
VEAAGGGASAWAAVLRCRSMLPVGSLPHGEEGEANEGISIELLISRSMTRNRGSKVEATAESV